MRSLKSKSNYPIRCGGLETIPEAKRSGIEKYCFCQNFLIVKTATAIDI
jgi:hypothetical protein